MNPWQRWDSWHYQSVATQGYPQGSLEVAFFPLYPLLIRITSIPALGAIPVAALLVSTVAAVFGLWMLHRLLCTDLGDAMADRTLLYVGLAPMALFLIAPYTEALFLALSVAAFLALRSRRLAVAGLLIAAATLTRPQGILLLLPAAVEVAPPLLAALRQRHRPPIGVGHLLLGTLPVVVLVAWVAVAARMAGLTPFAAEERGWGGHLAWPWDGLVHGLTTTAIYPGPLINSAAVFGWMCLLGLLVRHRQRVPASYIAYAAVSLLPIVIREEGFGNPWASAPRFALVVFPLGVAVALLTESRPRLHRVAVGLSALLAAASLVTFTHNQFIA